MGLGASSAPWNRNLLPLEHKQIPRRGHESGPDPFWERVSLKPLPDREGWRATAEWRRRGTGSPARTPPAMTDRAGSS
jgi:hypothetical protein